ncbi:inactive RHOMBOID-like protein 8 [Humulus lupulus]|uniref:inactive RHOMBOID-like protein 8 n=1 Tax=Humulus lupulus TaxID=3486 RepID=UPI002B415EC6|nr:inactive RHOMBOID-like protein 8 [Humulus lupulus]
MAETLILETQIEIKPPPPPFFLENIQEQTVVLSFFKSCHRRRRQGDTWLISIFLILPIIAFLVTMFLNDCWRKSHGDCVVKPLGRFSFQPLSENPFLGPSASTLGEVGALRRTFFIEHRQNWRFFAFQCLHAGLIHLVINLGSVVFVGIHLEREFGPLMVGIIYLLSSFSGTLMAALFVQNKPAVGSSGPLYGLLGAALSELVWNWRMYIDKFTALASLFLVCMINLALGLLPYVDNFSSLGGFIAGILLGSVLLCSSQIEQNPQNNGKGALFEHSENKSFTKLRLKQKLDMSILRTLTLALFCVICTGCLVALLRGIDMNDYCNWCRYIDCVPTKRWSCEDRVISCETMVSKAELTLTCLSNGKFKVFPYTNISRPRVNDICSEICGY